MSDPEHSRPARGEDTTGCPDENELVGFLQGVLSLDGRARLESHCAGCERCREALGAAGTSLVRSGSISSGGALPALQREIASAVRGLLGDAARADTGTLIGQRIGRFEICALMGRGQFGVVYRARDTELGRMVAVKVMRRARHAGVRDPAFVEALLRTEAGAVARLQHPNIVTLYDYGVFEGTPYLILELLEGESLRSRIAEGARVTPREALAIIAEVTRGLLEAHASGVIHRDIKPSNIFVCTGGQIKILDFGLARLLDPEHESAVSAAPAGTPRYMAPELFDGHPADACSDTYAVGVTLLDLLTGVMSSPDGATIAECIDRAPVSPRLRRLLRAATAPRRNDRFQTAGELLAEVLRTQRDLARRVHTRRLGLAFAGLVVAAVVAVAYRGVPHVPRPGVAALGDNAGSSRDPCRNVAHADNGRYCGASTQAGFGTRDARPDIVYQCYDGQTASQTRCPGDCFIAPAGSPDACSATDPCVHVSRDSGDGTYCGDSRQGFFSGDVRLSQDLFTCRNSTMVDGTRCRTSCIAEPPGSLDRCDPDPCTDVSHDHNGVYCGMSTRSGFDRQDSSFLVLYTCTDGRTTGTVFCRNGCTVGASDSPDHCN